MKPWMTDARESINDLEKVDEIDFEYIEITKPIENFLRDDNYKFLIGTKGLGKSLLLLSKRKQFKEALLIPRDIPLDVPLVKIDGLSRESLARMSEETNFVLIWSLSILIAICIRLNLVDEKTEDISKSLSKILHANRYSNISDVFGVIIGMDSKQIFEELLGDYTKILMPAIRTIKSTVAAFIDNVDECFANYGSSGHGIWYISQMGLIKAVYDIVRANGKIKVFASIRKEAFLKIDSEMLLQYKGVSLMLDYSKNQLREIFERNIKKDDPAHLVVIDDDAVVSFMGCDTITHGFTDEDEEIFDYIFRHTLKRPRDLMEIGLRISETNINERNPATAEGVGNIKKIINNAGTIIAIQYIDEVIKHLSITKKDLDKLFSLIDSNILSSRKVKNICTEFNGGDKSCQKANCKICNKTHMFCELYKVGLLGYVDIDAANDKLVQHFVPVGEKTFDDVGLLPISKHYLIHPILDGLIRLHNHNYKNNVNTINIVGYDRPWSSVKPNVSKAKKSSAIKNDKISILFIASDPSDETRLRIGKEYSEIKNALMVSDYRDLFELELPELSLRPSNISQALIKYKPRILHFSGHGNSDGHLAFEDENGKALYVKPEIIADLFKVFSEDIKCLILNACYSSKQASFLSRHIEFVIAMKACIDDSAAINFSIGFYRAIGGGFSVIDSFRIAKSQLSIVKYSERDTPILFVKGREIK
jgi:hypothetical protein